MAPVAHSHYILLFLHSSLLGDTTGSLMDHMPTGGIPHALPVAFRHWLPFPGLGTMPNSICQCSDLPLCMCFHLMEHCSLSSLPIVYQIITVFSSYVLDINTSSCVVASALNTSTAVLLPCPP